MERARAAAEFIGPGVEAVLYEDLPAHASRILIAVADHAVEPVAESLSARWPSHGGVALHTCGAKGVEALDALCRRGIHCGTLHPLQTIPDPATGVQALRGVAFAVSGDPLAVAWAQRIAGLCGGSILEISAEFRPLYHAAAVMAGNYVVALLAAAETLLGAAGVESTWALEALGPLVRSSVDNALRAGPAAALTGPISRGDAATVAAHLQALARTTESIRDLYRAAGIQTLELARRRGLDAAQAAAIEDILR